MPNKACRHQIRRPVRTLIDALPTSVDLASAWSASIVHARRQTCSYICLNPGLSPSPVPPTIIKGRFTPFHHWIQYISLDLQKLNVDMKTFPLDPVRRQPAQIEAAALRTRPLRIHAARERLMSTCASFAPSLCEVDRYLLMMFHESLRRGSPDERLKTPLLYATPMSADVGRGRQPVPTRGSADICFRGSAQPLPTDPLNAVILAFQRQVGHKSGRHHRAGYSHFTREVHTWPNLKHTEVVKLDYVVQTCRSLAIRPITATEPQVFQRRRWRKGAKRVKWEMVRISVDGECSRAQPQARASPYGQAAQTHRTKFKLREGAKAIGKV
ncbi:hypothetical protein B0H11DRAFT_1914432 [Mycena galericulata]|nr:hypothetical protein B0H11DRAFT_1914432 [Mycena galericulata]